jgi:hypothetical protein
LPTPEEIKDEYADKENKLEVLLNDTSLLIDDATIDARAKNYENKAGLIKHAPLVIRDQNSNPRTDFLDGKDTINWLLEKSHIEELEIIIGTLFSTWENDGNLIGSQVSSILVTSFLAGVYDWQIFQQGINRHFEKDYVSSIHILIPQFENILRTWAKQIGVATKKMDAHAKGIVWGDMLLGNLLSDPKVVASLGDDLVKVIKWYFTNEPFGYRHKVAHGFIHSEQCNSSLSSMIIWLTLLVINKPLLEN